MNRSLRKFHHCADLHRNHDIGVEKGLSRNTRPGIRLDRQPMKRVNLASNFDHTLHRPLR